MKKFEAPAMEVIKFSVEDVINESSTPSNPLEGMTRIGNNCVSGKT